MGLWSAVLLGIIQGAAEFLPISSSGHLAIFKNLFGLSDVSISFDILLHMGTLVAVCLVYWKDIVRLIVDGIGILVDFFYNIYAWIQRKRGMDMPRRRVITSAYRKFALLVVVSTIPTGIMGILLGDVVDVVSKTMLVPGIALLVTGVLLMICDLLPAGSKTPKQTGWGTGLFLGIAQGFAVLPGISRSGTTITAGVFCGLRRDFAVKYSFIMSIPAILGAMVLDGKELFTANLAAGELACYFVGAVVAAVVGYICIKTLLVVVRKKNFRFFAYYCFIVGAIAIVAHFVMN
jgi:undecaprenyl-diphosphatase